MSLVDQAVEKVQMTMNIDEADNRICSLHGSYIQPLKAAGCGTLSNNKAQTAIKHVFHGVRPAQLKSNIENIIRWREDEKLER